MLVGKIDLFNGVKRTSDLKKSGTNYSQGVYSSYPKDSVSFGKGNTEIMSDLVSELVSSASSKIVKAKEKFSRVLKESTDSLSKDGIVTNLSDKENRIAAGLKLVKGDKKIEFYNSVQGDKVLNITEGNFKSFREIRMAKGKPVTGLDDGFGQKELIDQLTELLNDPKTETRLHLM